MASSVIQPNGQHSTNTSADASALSSPDLAAADGGDAARGDDTDTGDAISKGKQRAQAKMKEALSSRDATATDSTLSNNSAANGTPTLSRKRSRDGTQLPLKSRQQPPPGPPGGEDEYREIMIDRYLQRDLMYGATGIVKSFAGTKTIEKKQKEKEWYAQVVRPQRQRDPGLVFGHGYAGYGNGTTSFVPDQHNRVLYSAMRPPPKGRRAPQLRTSRKDTQQQAGQIEQLVPIRIDIELEKLRLRDTFTWNLQEKLITPAMFTDHLIEDLRVPPENIPEIARQIRFEIEDQTHNFYPHIMVEDGAAEPGQPYTDYRDEEMRIQVKLNITIGRVTLVDQFEWDINNPHNSPEEFAKHMAWENALSGEFTTAIAHSIREQSHQYTKSLWLTNHIFDGRPIEDPDVRDAFLPAPIFSSFRPQQSQKDWTPYMYEMSEAELERTETVMMREHRAQKRQLNRRGGPALPDLKERQRTVRSLFVHKVIPGAVETWETSGIPKTRRAGRTGRRPGARGADDDVDSSDLESEDENPESPLPSSTFANPGTARTRNMRGAASAAQAAMRANYGRSLTPDSQLATPQQESRVGARRSMLREESVAEDGETLIVKLRIGKLRFKQWWDEYRAKKRASEFPLSGYASAPLSVPSREPVAATPKKEATLATPAVTPRNLRDGRTPTANGGRRGKVEYDDMGRVEVDHWPGPDDTAPAPPPWLQTGIKNLQDRHPESDFEPLMRPYCLNNETDAVYRPNPPLDAGASAPDGTRIVLAPKIRCNDCPGKVYTTVPGKVEEDFEVHLKNRTHRERVSERVSRQGRGRRA